MGSHKRDGEQFSLRPQITIKCPTSVVDDWGIEIRPPGSMLALRLDKIQQDVYLIPGPDRLRWSC